MPQSIIFGVITQNARNLWIFQNSKSHLSEMNYRKSVQNPAFAKKRMVGLNYRPQNAKSAYSLYYLLQITSKSAACRFLFDSKRKKSFLLNSSLMRLAQPFSQRVLSHSAHNTQKDFNRTQEIVKSMDNTSEFYFQFLSNLMFDNNVKRRPFLKREFFCIFAHWLNFPIKSMRQKVEFFHKDFAYSLFLQTSMP